MNRILLNLQLINYLKILIIDMATSLGIENPDSFIDLNYTMKKMDELLLGKDRIKIIRSQQFIKLLHFAIAMNLYKRLNIPAENIFLEVKLKNKNVDIAIINGERLNYVITVRSQMFSVKKNFTNNINSLQGELVSLKTLYPGLYVGLIYLLKGLDENEQCLIDYYKEQIPRKLFPMINTYNSTNQTFDSAAILLYESFLDDDFNSRCPVPDIFNVYNFEVFLNDFKEHYFSQKPVARRSLLQLIEESNTLKEFLGKT